MESIIPIILVVVVIVIIAASVLYFGIGSSAKTTHKSNTIKNSSVTTNALSSSTTSTVKSSTTTASQQTYCLSNSPTERGGNWNFSYDSYYNWNVTGNAFGTAPTNFTKANDNGSYFRYAWSNLAETYYATSFSKTKPIGFGNLTTTFLVDKRYLNFQLISTNNSRIYVEIIINGQPSIVKHYDTGSPYDQFVSEYINLSDYTCQTVKFRVVSDAPAGQDFIAIGDLYLT